MSLSFLTRLIVFLVTLATVAIGGWQVGPTLASYLKEAQSSTTLDADIDDRAIVYRLRSDRPLEFASSQPIDVVRGLVQAPCSESTARYSTSMLSPCTPMRPMLFSPPARLGGSFETGPN